MFCEQCGFELIENSKFCEKCGHPISGMENNVNTQPSVPMQPGYYGNPSQMTVNNKNKGIKVFVGAVVVIVALVICIGMVSKKDKEKKQSTFGQPQSNEAVTNQEDTQGKYENEILPADEVDVTNDEDLGAYGQCIGYWAKNNVDTLSAETFWIQPPLVMEITEEFVMIHGPNYRANRKDLQHNEINGVDYFTSVENGFRFYYSSSESLLVLELQTDSGSWMRWADFK